MAQISKALNAVSAESAAPSTGPTLALQARAEAGERARSRMVMQRRPHPRSRDNRRRATLAPNCADRKLPMLVHHLPGGTTTRLSDVQQVVKVGACFDLEGDHGAGSVVARSLDLDLVPQHHPIGDGVRHGVKQGCDRSPSSGVCTVKVSMWKRLSRRHVSCNASASVASLPRAFLTMP